MLPGGGWKPYNLHDLAHVSWVGSVLYRSCTTYRIGRLASLEYLDRDSVHRVKVCNGVDFTRLALLLCFPSNLENTIIFAFAIRQCAA